MNLEAINHIPKSNYAYAYREDELHVRVRTAKNDMDQVDIYYGIKYQWDQKQKRTMKKVLSDEFYDYYQYNIKQEDTRLGYYFGFKKGEEEIFYTEVGFVKEFNDSMAYCYFFQYPFINEVDVHKEPSWISEAIFYQIFVERFFNGDPDNSPDNLTNWNEDPTPTSFFGGDLVGIIKKMDYLVDLGVNGIYLTPVFDSISNHKYDTTDYLEIDSYFGTKEILKELVDKAHEKGLKVVLDAVFNHCGLNFKPFQDVIQKGKKSKYWDWFYIEDEPVTFDPINFKAFGFVPYMPKLNTSNEEVKEYLLQVTEYWTKEYDIDGWRLDVSDEIDHRFWRDFRDLVKGINEDIIIIGENWHNAYPWLMGDQFDSVMNYPVTKLTLDYFAREEIGPMEFSNGLSTLLMRYPTQVNEAMLNLLDSHDTERFLTTCKEEVSGLKNAAAFLFGYLGMPCTYYGTEIGMTGVYDPGCRKGFDWNSSNWDMDLYSYYKKLIKIRNQEQSLKYGDVTFLSTEDLFIMKREWKEEKIYIIINQTRKKQSLSINKWGLGDSFMELITDKIYQCTSANKIFEIEPKKSYFLKVFI